ncbi:MAG: serine/threonine-protein kinase [Leptolyngbyaceae cyanobacterium bins.302]|nr:serine/threonine-protein kinase [Leptolyngbyaceae cyanobacterium bins.302]
MSLVYPGACLQNRYHVLQPLGKGGLSQTYDVEDVGTIKVLKVLNLQRFDNQEGKQKAIALFQREADVLSRLDFPGIPRVEADGYFVLGEPGQEPIYCLVMEKIVGQDLEQWLEARNNEPIAQTQAVSWLRQLVIILETLHQAGLIHRDIKPANIMLRPDGQLFLIDFGGVREVTETYLRNITGTGLISPGYTPPEQAEGKAVLQSDYFALGRTVVHLLTGKHPLDFERDLRTGKLLWYGSALQITKPFADLIDYLMAIMPGRRPQTAQLILKYLDEIEASVIASTTIPKLMGAIAVPQPANRPRRNFLHGLTQMFRPALAVDPWEKVAFRRTLTGHTDVVSAIAISPDSQLLVSASHDTTIRLWSLQSKNLVQTLVGHRDRLTDVAISPNGQLLASCSHDKMIQLWSLPEGALQQTLAGHAHKINALSFSPNGRILLSISGRETKVWSVQTGRLLHSFAEHRSDTVRAIAFNGDGKVCAIGYLNGTIEFWNPASGQLLRTIANQTGGVTSVAFSPDGRLFASSIGRTLQLWDAKTWEPLRTLDSSVDGSFSIAFSPNSRMLASGGDRDIRLWNPATGQLLHRLFGHTGTIRTLAFSPNGHCLASGSQDKTIKLWLPIP